MISPQYYGAAVAVFGTHGRSSGGLEPGEVSRSFEFTFLPAPQTDHFRVWIDLRRRWAVEPYPATPAVKQPPSDNNPLGADVDAFIASAHLPQVHERRAIFRMPGRDLVLFTVTYGPPQDCGMAVSHDGLLHAHNPTAIGYDPRCTYAGVLGLKFGRKIGWVQDKPYLGDTPERAQWRKLLFPLSSQDEYLLSVPFLDTLASVFGRRGNVTQDLTSMVLAQPDVPRATLARLAESLIGDDNIAELLLAHPTVKRDSELLLGLAHHPDRNLRRLALDALSPLAPSLVANPTTSARTLFLLATAVPLYIGPSDSLFKRIATHPNARGNLALQIVTHHPYLSLVNASPRVRTMLERCLSSAGAEAEKGALGAQLLADPETGHNPDVLLALANGSSEMLVAWEATRRLPPTALLRLETHLMPTPPTAAH
jgi:hypothetical protein